jgi:hypothetical protein
MMNRDFDIFVKEHLDEIFCQVEKDRALKMLRKTPAVSQKAQPHLHHHHQAEPEIHLQDCAIEPSLAHSHL